MDDKNNTDNRSGGESALPPPEPDIKIRVMSSDIEAVKAGGEAEPRFLKVEPAENSEMSRVPKAILLTIGIFLLAGAIGFLAYYLALKIL